MVFDNVDLILNTVDHGAIILDDQLNILFWNKWLILKTKIESKDILNQNICKKFSSINSMLLKKEIKEVLLMQRESFYNLDSQNYFINIPLDKTTDQLFENMQQSIKIVPYDIEKKIVCIYIYDTTYLAITNKALKERVKYEVNKNLERDKILQKDSKLVYMGEMITSIAHQWRQPLNALGVNIQFLKDDYEEGLLDLEYIHEYILKNMQLINFMSTTIDEFRNFFMMDREKIVFDLKEIILDTLRIIFFRLMNSSAKINFIGNSFEVLGYINGFQQVILNIINNSLDVFDEKNIQNGKIDIKFSKKREYDLLEIYDNGGGVQEEIMDRIFEPYFTTKEQGQGIGIGLYMSKMIIENHMNGKIEVCNTDKGALFKIKLMRLEDD